MEGKSDIYDFNAPQHYFDFKERMHEEPDDSYFDCQEGVGPYELETPQLKTGDRKPLRSSSRHNIGTPNRFAAVGTPKRALAAVGTPKRRPVTSATPKKPPTPVKVENKLPTPAKVEKKQPTPAKVEKKQPTPAKVAVNIVEQSEDKENTLRTAENTPRSTESEKETKVKRTRSFSPGVRSSPRLQAIAKALHRSNAARRSAGSGSRRSSNGNNSNLSVVNKQKTQNKPSVPKVHGMRGLSEMDRSDLESIATFKKKFVTNKKKAGSAAGPLVLPTVTVPQGFNFATDARLRQKNPEEPAPVRSTTPVRKTRHGPTIPQEFNFATDNRIKKQETTSDDQDAVSFPQFLRSGSSVVDKEQPKGPTIPQPFNLTETRKNAGSEVNKFVSVAELNLKFHTRTPQRFRSRRSDDSDESHIIKKSKSNSGVTIPVTPNFATRTRSRQVSYLTREEMEQKAFEEEQKHKFKANPVNKKVFDAPALGTHAERKVSTIPEPFNITKTKKEVAPLGDNFKEMCNKLGCSTSSIASLPWGGIPSKWDKSNTKVEPFSFDTRDKVKMQRKQEMIHKVIEDEKKLAEFHAHPMPVFEDGIRGVPVKKPPTPTRARPFNLRSDQRGEAKQENIKRTLEEQERIDRERRAFQATSDAVLHKQPFIPEKSNKPLTDISGFTLNTEVRAEARTEFETHQKMKEDELLAAKKEREDRQAAEEAAEITRLRREAVHKANPVRNYKPVEIKPAPCPVTVPISPNLATKTRLRARVSNSTDSTNSTMNISTATFTSD